MRIEDLFSSNGTSNVSALPVSFEIFPPKGTLDLDTVHMMVGELTAQHPSFISVTCSAGGSGNSGNTVEVAHLIQNDFNTTSMAHLTCVNETHESICAKLARMKEAGIENVLALRGDMHEGAQFHEFQYAKDLIRVVAEEGFCVGAAAYPEGHIACDDFALSLKHLKEKQDAGARFFVTQLFFDNEYAFRFLDEARNAGITVPITFGVMPFMSKEQISRMVFMCGASLPSPIIKLLARYENDPQSLLQAGIEYACEQFVGLAEAGVDGVHVYTMNKPQIARAARQALTEAGF